MVILRNGIRTLSSVRPPGENEDVARKSSFLSPSLSSAFCSTTNIMRQSYASLTDAYSQIAQSNYGQLMRLHKPTGIHLLFLPCAWSISMTATSPTDWFYLMPLFYTGSVLLRGAGCTINDIWDAGVDRHVERTRNRPIASGAISTTSGFLFLGGQLAGGLLILLQLNTASFLLASLSVIPVMTYPFSKRFTRFPQAVLGLTINWGALLGSTAAVGVVTPECALLYGAGWFWTMIYDTIYAHQDKKDDLKIGVLSTALTFGDRSKTTLGLCLGAHIGLLTAAGIVADLSWPYFMCVGASGMHIAKLVTNTDLDKVSECSMAFKNNVTAGVITVAGVVLGRIIQ